MKITDLNATCKSHTSNSQDIAKKTIQKIDAITSQLKQLLLDSAQQGESFDSVERKTRDIIFQIGKQSMDLFVSLQGNGDLGETTTTEDGKTLHRSEKTATTNIRSIFGVHRFEQFTYAPGAKKAIELRPISARMSLPSKQWSYLLQEFSQMLAVDSAYEQAMDNLGQLLGGKFSVDTAERINTELGQSAGEYLSDLPDPEPETEAKFLVATADCKGVPLVKEDATKTAAFEQTKKNPGNRRMATVASVYTVEPHIRTAEEITAALFRDCVDENAEKPERPRPQNKNTTAHLPEQQTTENGNEITVSGIQIAMVWLISQVVARRRQGQVLIALMDGQPSLWQTLQSHLEFAPRTIPILDIIHVLSYVWEAASLFEKDDSRRKAFTRARLLRILRGEVQNVIRGLRCLGTSRGLKGKNAEALRRICGYLENNAEKMRYDEYLRRGYPIASGVIEGACRHLVKDRMERSGMRWTLEGARNMLHVRAAFQSDHWRSFLDQRMQNEIVKTHPHQNLLNDYKAIVLAC